MFQTLQAEILGVFGGFCPLVGPPFRGSTVPLVSAVQCKNVDAAAAATDNK